MDSLLIEQVIRFLNIWDLMDCGLKCKRNQLRGWIMASPYGKIFNITTQCSQDHMIDLRFDRDGNILKISGFRRIIK